MNKKVSATQEKVMQLFRENDGKLTTKQLSRTSHHWKKVINSLIAKGIVDFPKTNFKTGEVSYSILKSFSDENKNQYKNAWEKAEKIEKIMNDIFSDRLLAKISCVILGLHESEQAIKNVIAAVKGDE
jgi:predicted transcriptional regulator